MTEAEKRALNFYPVLFSERIGLDKIRPQVRVGFENGYDQAVKDVELWLKTHVYTFESPEIVELFFELFAAAFKK